MSIKMKVEIEIKPPKWPNFVEGLEWHELTGGGVSMREGKLPIGKLDDETVERLCDSFRDHVKRKRDEMNAPTPRTRSAA